MKKCISLIQNSSSEVQLKRINTNNVGNESKVTPAVIEASCATGGHGMLLMLLLERSVYHKLCNK